MQDSSNYYFPVMGGGGSSKPEQAKTVDITSNGTVVVTPDEGMTLSSVTVNTSVAAQSIFPQVIDGTVTEITAADLQGATKILYYSFYSSNITSIEIPDGVTLIGTYAFYDCSSLTSITIPDGVTVIGKSAFNGCSNLPSITLPNSITTIANNTFQGCDKLESIEIPDSVTSIGAYAFEGCDSLTLITIPDSVTSIGAYAFMGCDSLTLITIPDSVTSIGDYALRIGSATNKATITIMSTTPPPISSSIFNASYLNQIIVPAGTGDTYKSATNWSNFADYIVEATA